MSTDDEKHDTIAGGVTQTDSAVPSDPAEDTLPGSVPTQGAFGRFTILDVLGAGGMGIVLAAYDPQLDRKVAIKILRTRGLTGERQEREAARLLREARSMAQLSHPHVVTVYDAGTIDGRVFVAMEYISGLTLRSWLGEGTRSVAEILDVFVKAGRGLAAGHHAGLVHRDFKPDNVLIGFDGRVRVIDFGLARPTGATTGGEDGAAMSPATPLRLTTVGALFGTPLYMAPEQHEKKTLDARVDQFAFCVALYEGLYGKPPFPTQSLPLLIHAVTTGQVIPPEPRPEIPARVVAALMKGLRPDPDDRFVMIDALLDELHAPQRRRRGLAIASMALGAIAAAITTVIVLRVADDTQAGDPCEGGRARLAGVWDDAIKQRVKAAFLASHRTHAPETVGRVDGLLDAYAETWVDLRRSVCEATKVRHEQSDSAFDLRMECLGKQLEELKALAGLFAKADVATVDNAVVAARSLGAADGCLRLVPGAAQPPTPAQQPAVEALARRLAEVRANIYAHHYVVGASKATEVLEVAKQLGYLPIEAEARYWLGLAQSGASKPADAERTLRDALDVAARAKEDVLIARIWTTLIFIVGNQLARTADALALEPVAQVAVRRADDAPSLQADLAFQVGAVYLLKGEYKPAAERLEQAVKLRGQVGGEDQPEVAQMLNALGGAQLRTGNIFAAKTTFDRALAIVDKTLGPAHPEAGMTLANVGALSQAMGQFDEATKSHQRALALLEEVKGSDGLDVGLTVYSLGVDANGREDYKAAIPYYERALHIFEKVSAEHPYVGLSLVGLADCREEVGDAATAVPEAERGLALVEKQASDPGQLALARYVLAKALWSANRDKPRALVLGDQARKGFAAGGLALLNGRVAVDNWFKKIGKKPPN